MWSGLFSMCHVMTLRVKLNIHQKHIISVIVYIYLFLIKPYLGQHTFKVVSLGVFTSYSWSHQVHLPDISALLGVFTSYSWSHQVHLPDISALLGVFTSYKWSHQVIYQLQVVSLDYLPAIGGLIRYIYQLFTTLLHFVLVLQVCLEVHKRLKQAQQRKRKNQVHCLLTSENLHLFFFFFFNQSLFLKYSFRIFQNKLHVYDILCEVPLHFTGC